LPFVCSVYDGELNRTELGLNESRPVVNKTQFESSWVRLVNGKAWAVWPAAGPYPLMAGSAVHSGHSGTARSHPPTSSPLSCSFALLLRDYRYSFGLEIGLSGTLLHWDSAWVALPPPGWVKHLTTFRVRWALNPFTSGGLNAF